MIRHFKRPMYKFYFIKLSIFAVTKDNIPCSCLRATDAEHNGLTEPGGGRAGTTWKGSRARSKAAVSSCASSPGTTDKKQHTRRKSLHLAWKSGCGKDCVQYTVLCLSIHGIIPFISYFLKTVIQHHIRFPSEPLEEDGAAQALSAERRPASSPQPPSSARPRDTNLPHSQPLLRAHFKNAESEKECLWAGWFSPDLSWCSWQQTQYPA